MATEKHLTLEYTPRAWQQQCHSHTERFAVYALHRRAGKTYFALIELITEAIVSKNNLPFYIYVAPFLGQAKAIAWARLKDMLNTFKLEDIVSFNESELSVKFNHNGALIRLFGADNPNTMRGLTLDGCVIDEVAQIKPDVWDKILQPALSDRKGWAIFIGTPNGINLFSQLFHRAKTLDGWVSARYTVNDTDSLDPDEVERLKRDMSENSFAREYLCDFSAAGDDQLISVTDAEEASMRVYTERDVIGAPVILGVDPARFGDDRSVVFRRQGLQAFDPHIYRGINNMDLAARVASLINKHKPDAVFIDSGAGAGVIDRLRQLDYDVIEVPFGGRATDPTQYKNKRMEMWADMADWLRMGGAIPDRQDLKEEISTPTYWFDATGKKCLESKDDIKKRLQGGASPDLADALALTFAMPVRPKSEREMFMEAQGTQINSRRSYDPMARI